MVIGKHFEGEADVAGVGGRLVDFHGEGVRAVDQQAGRGMREDRPVIHYSRCQSGKEDRPRRHVVAQDFGAVDVHQGAIVADHSNQDVCDVESVINVEGMPEIRGDVFIVRVRAEAVGGRFVTVAVAELGNAVAPAAVVKTPGAPGGPLVRAVVQISPIRVGGDEDVRKRRGGVEKCEGQSSNEKRSHTFGIHNFLWFIYISLSLPGVGNFAWKSLYVGTSPDTPREYATHCSSALADCGTLAKTGRKINLFLSTFLALVAAVLPQRNFAEALALVNASISC